MRKWSFEHNAVMENGEIIYTKEQIEYYKVKRRSYRELFKKINEKYPYHYKLNNIKICIQMK